MRAGCTALVLLIVAGSAHASTVYFTPQYGELVDRGNVYVDIHPDRGTLDCRPPVIEIFPTVIVVTVQKSAVDRTEPCANAPRISIGVLSAGQHRVTTRVVEANGTTVDERTDVLDVLPLEGRCNRDPTISPQGLIVAARPGAGDVRGRIATDPAYAARLDNPTVIGFSSGFLFGYPPLHDLTVAAAHVFESGDFASVEQNRQLCFPEPPPDSVARVVEFYNTRLDHYFYTPNAGEIAAIEAGAVGPDWQRTGEGFEVVVSPGCPFDVDTPVYRFAGIPNVGPSSHFFTRDRAECYVVDKSGRWSFEGLPFWAAPVAADGTCPQPNLVPLLRVWRPFGDSNHRFTTERAVVDAMVAKGWVDEGAAMCVRAP
jgi:hypothetical protein